MTRRRVFAIVVGVAVLATAVGYAAASRVSTPEEEASRAEPPEPRAVTAAVESRTLTSEVVTRGDAVFDEAVDVAVETSGLETPAVLTGRAPEVGDPVTEGDPVLEITGRPVIALDGELPTYRSLGPGASGPDVAQLEAALDRLGIDAGAIDDVYDEATAAGVAELYSRAGYAAPAPPAAIQERLDTAQKALDDATQALAQANIAFFLAAQPPKESDRIAADAAVNAARRALDEARAGGVAAEIADASDQLAVATAQRSELRAPPDTSAELAAVTVADDQLARATAEMAAAETAATTPLPAAEVVFIPALPRRIDAVHLARGGIVDTPPISVSGADIVIHVELDNADRALVDEGMDAAVAVRSTAGSGTETVAGRITELVDDPATGSSTATISLVDPTPEQLDAVRGQNVKVTIPVATTGGDVLAVPLAALSAGPDGTPRIERELGTGETELIPVEVGLAAGGFAEIDPLAGLDGVTADVAPGDRVVVGR